MRTIQQGSKCLDVIFLQYILGQPLDGIFGEKTASALKDLQKEMGLTVDGVCGPNTWKKLIEKYRVLGIKESEWVALAEKLGVEVAALKAVKEVESPKSGFDSSLRPTCLFEAHLFWKELQSQGINPAGKLPGNADILSKTWNKALYVGGSAEWDRLEKAFKISPKAALRSASYGSFQIIGQNHSLAGCPSVSNFLAEMWMGDINQLRLFGNFLEKGGFIPLLKKLNWAGFAKKYNGPGYAQNKYDQKLAAAYKKHKK